MATIGLSKTEVALAADFPKYTVGTKGEITDSNGTSEYLYVHAAEAVTGAGYLCQVDSAGEAQMVDSTSSAPGTGVGLRCGVAMAAIADNDWFWIQVYGKGSLRTLASAAVGTALNSTATPGAVDDAGSGFEVINGLSLGTATGGSEATNADAYFNYPCISSLTNA